MTAAFPWYDLPSVRWANDVLWKATGLGGKLDRDTPPDAQWRFEDLVVSQGCGLDLFLRDAPIEPVLAPVFDLDCEEGTYYGYLTPDGCTATNSVSVKATAAGRRSFAPGPARNARITVPPPLPVLRR